MPGSRRRRPLAARAAGLQRSGGDANRAVIPADGVKIASFHRGSDFQVQRNRARVDISGGVGDGGGRVGAGLQASLAGRYASALFELARDDKSVEAVELSLSTLQAALTQSADFRRLTTSPLVNRAAAGRAVDAAAGQMDLDPLTRRFLGVLAENRRLSEIGHVVRAFRQLAAAWRGEASAEVTSAHPLSDDQVEELKHQLRARVGREVRVDLQVDPALLGGLVVRIGSQMIDSSIRTRLNALARTLKTEG
jgi:F-type H+-transporting ATPase subunit delta